MTLVAHYVFSKTITLLERDPHGRNFCDKADVAL